MFFCFSIYHLPITVFNHLPFTIYCFSFLSFGFWYLSLCFYVFLFLYLQFTIYYLRFLSHLLFTVFIPFTVHRLLFYLVSLCFNRLPFTVYCLLFLTIYRLHSLPFDFIPDKNIKPLLTQYLLNTILSFLSKNTGRPLRQFP